ncbi:MAG: uroporphyrinogen decarboxylase [Sandaracinus sp.]|nr:uroporphyrinogen decarboxylase [Sandaracinus sp.]|tara:strand:+ start:433 stop:1461 length:1029 start_codon:yes stop_codon:yes gene_type:complete
MSAFLDACRRKPSTHTPIWLMRQAGRYQASYQAIRSKVSFLELCKTPDLACQVTVDAVEQLGVDAAIIFADILLVLDPLGIDFDFEKGHGPKIYNPVRDAKAIDAMPETIDAEASLGYVMEAIRLVRRAIDVPLIGFSAAPFTLAAYAIEGGGSKSYYETKQLMYGDEGAWKVLMTKVADALALYLRAQVDAGAQALQLFDSWVGILSPADYERYVAPYTKRIFDALSDVDVPTLHFGTGNPELLVPMQEVGGDVIGVDWRIDLGDAWDRLGGPEETAVQGNLEPAMLLAPVDVMKAAADEVLKSAGGHPGHIFNLGHGIMPTATVDQVRALVDHVHEKTSR